MRTVSAELWADPGAGLGEGPLWIAPDLWAIDITAGVLFRIPLGADGRAGRVDRFQAGPSIGSVVPRASGGLAAALDSTIVALDFDGKLQGVIWKDSAPESGMRFNDGKCDPRGRYLVGTMHARSIPDRGALYSYETDGSRRTLLEPVSISNGLAWNDAGNRLYYIDTPTRKVRSFAYDLDSGTIAEERTVVDIPAAMGMPDGMTMDNDGRLWIALWGGGGVGCWDPDSGRLETFIEVPVANVTSCTFGGPGMDMLFITTARDSRSNRGGSLFACRPGCSGPPPFAFAG